MKAIKKLFIFLFIIPLMTFSVVACKNKEEISNTTEETQLQSEWVEVYKISYNNSANEQVSICSTWDLQYTTTEITFEEYNELYQTFTYNNYEPRLVNQFFQKSLSHTFEYIENYKDYRYAYSVMLPYTKYYKAESPANCTLNYVLVQILGENYFKYKYKGEEKLIYTNLFEIEYFIE